MSARWRLVRRIAGQVVPEGASLGEGSLTDRLPWVGLAIAAWIALGALGYTAVLRVAYPFELEWMEGGVLDDVRVVLAGEPLYRAPSLEFTPFIYTPLYYYACALPALLFGPSFAVARLVSIAAIVTCLFLVHAFVRRETSDAMAALVATGLFGATYGATSFWFDLARPDSLALALLLGGLYVARFAERRRSAIAAALLLAAAVLTKQTMLAPSLAGLLAVVLPSRSRGAWCVATFVGVLGGAILVLDVIFGGWFSYYTIWVPRQHGWLWDRWRPLLIDFLWRPIGAMGLWALFALFSPALRDDERRRWWFYSSLLVLSVGSAYAGILHRDGFVNVYIPAHASLAIVAGIGLAWVRRRAEQGDIDSRLRWFAALTLLLQFAVLYYPPRVALPSQADVRAGRAMVAQLREAPGELLVLGHGFYGFMAGHPERHAHSMALTDLFKTTDKAVNGPLLETILQAIRDQRFGSIAMDQSVTLLPRPIGREIKRHYRRQTGLFDEADEHRCRPRGGFPSRPDELWVPRRRRER